MVDLDFVKHIARELKEMNKGKKGSPYKYPASLFRFLGYLRIFIPSYRALEGICRVLSELIVGFPTPDHSTIHRRIEGKFENLGIKGNVLIVDSTGFQMGRTTEYVEYKHKLRRRKKWLKVHIITDGEKIVAVEITASNVGDSPVFIKMFDRLRKILEKTRVKITIMGDATYDAREKFNIVEESGHRPLFKVRSNSSTLSVLLQREERRLLSREMKTGAMNLATLKGGVWNPYSHL